MRRNEGRRQKQRIAGRTDARELGSSETKLIKPRNQIKNQENEQ